MLYETRNNNASSKLRQAVFIQKFFLPFIHSIRDIVTCHLNDKYFCNSMPTMPESHHVKTVFSKFTYNHFVCIHEFTSPFSTCDTRVAMSGLHITFVRNAHMSCGGKIQVDEVVVCPSAILVKEINAMQMVAVKTPALFLRVVLTFIIQVLLFIATKSTMHRSPAANNERRTSEILSRRRRR